MQCRNAESKARVALDKLNYPAGYIDLFPTCSEDMNALIDKCVKSSEEGSLSVKDAATMVESQMKQAFSCISDKEVTYNHGTILREVCSVNAAQLHSLSRQQPIDWQATTLCRLIQELPISWMVRNSTLTHEWKEGHVPMYRIKGMMKPFSMADYVQELKRNERVFCNVNAEWLSWKAWRLSRQHQSKNAEPKIIRGKSMLMANSPGCSEQRSRGLKCQKPL